MGGSSGTQVSIDAKGRMLLPVSVRKELAEQGEDHLVIIPGPDRSLPLYPTAAWAEVRERLESEVDNANPQQRDARQVILGMAQPLEIDTAGRILLPAALRLAVGVEKRAFLAPNGPRYDLWSEAVWAEKMARFFASDDQSIHNILALS